MMNSIPVTAYVSTRNRYDTTLPLCIMSIVNQTKYPDEILIYDDTDEKDRKNLHDIPHFEDILRIISKKGISCYVHFGAGKGQLLNHRRAFKDARNDLIWRIDDDGIAESDVLEDLYYGIKFVDNVGAIGCHIIQPFMDNFYPLIASNKIEDLFLGCNEQWYYPKASGIRDVDHLYSSFLYDRKKAKIDFYNYPYSPLAHREETIFTYSIKLAGHKVLLDDNAIIWHCHPSGKGGGNENKQKLEYVANDNHIFEGFCKSNNIKIKQPFPIILDNGLGDHFAFFQIFDKLLEKYKDRKIILSCCYPEVFEGYEDRVTLISIAEADRVFGKEAMEHFNIYRFLDMFWRQNGAKLHLTDGFKMLYKV